jgi:hypothetical protein
MNVQCGSLLRPVLHLGWLSWVNSQGQNTTSSVKALEVTVQLRGCLSLALSLC